MKIIVGALAAATLLIGVAATQPAEARCFWNGFAWQCWQPQPQIWWGGPVWHHAAWGPGWGPRWRHPGWGPRWHRAWGPRWHRGWGPHWHNRGWHRWR